MNLSRRQPYEGLQFPKPQDDKAAGVPTIGRFRLAIVFLIIQRQNLHI